MKTREYAAPAVEGLIIIMPAGNLFCAPYAFIRPGLLFFSILFIRICKNIRTYIQDLYAKSNGGR